MYKRFLLLTASCLLLCALMMTWQVWLQQRALADRLIRLHVVASSDDPRDQARKLQVRDAILPQIAALTADCPDAETAAKALERELPALEATAYSALGTGEPVHATLAQETFPRRDYDTFSLPAGSYRALRVTLGEGAGHNWWCVAFPALCLPAVTDQEPEDFRETALSAGLSPEQVELVTSDSQPVRFKFALLDWLTELLEG